TIESTAGYYVIFGLTDDLKNIVGDLAKSASVEYADFLDASGKVLASTKPELPAALTNRAPRRESGTSTGNGLHIYTVPFYESQAQTALSSLRKWAAGIVVLALLLSTLLAWGASGFIVRPILSLVETAQQISGGDLTQRVGIRSSDEIGGLAETFNGMAANLERTVKSLVQSQSKLKSVVESVSSRSSTMISRVDEQRAIIDDTYQSVDQLNGGVRKITDNVEALSASSAETSSSMLEMVASMEEVSRHTDTLFSSVEET